MATAGSSGSGATNYNNAGQYEFVVAKSAVSGGMSRSRARVRAAA